MHAIINGMQSMQFRRLDQASKLRADLLEFR